ncbi:MAG TPA: 50S ribosomal protein L30 [Spirochaetota bacterium]|nr:MAG: 50S ribosomal protein L30 [Spirochaetes bacterium ADurb.BinA120]HPO46953.1 50S ribosomal protein L30 [Spirochaetota bacterium]
MANRIEIKQIMSRNGKKPNQRKTLTALGLRKMNAVRVHDDNPVIRGMIMKVKHLVEVREIKK